MQAIRVTWVLIRVTTSLLKDNVYYTLLRIYTCIHTLRHILGFFLTHEQYLATYECKKFNQQNVHTSKYATKWCDICYIVQVLNQDLID